MKKSDLKVGTVLKSKGRYDIVIVGILENRVLYYDGDAPEDDLRVYARRYEALFKQGYLEEGEGEEEEFLDDEWIYYVDADGGIEYALYSKNNVFHKKLIAVGNAHHSEEDTKNSELYKFFHK